MKILEIDTWKQGGVKFVLSDFGHITRVLRKRGLQFLWDYFRESMWFDLRHRTSTFSRVPKAEQSFDSSRDEEENGLLYVASFTSVIRNTLKIAHMILGPERANYAEFIDLGCGKGKALLVHAQEFGKNTSAKAVGIEYDPVLTEIARENVAKLDLARGHVEIFTDSATNLRTYLSTDEVIVYLYNSFQGETLDRTLDALNGLPHVLIYVDPAERGKLVSRGYEIVEENVGRYNADTWLVARSSDLASAE